MASLGFESDILNRFTKHLHPVSRRLCVKTAVILDKVQKNNYSE